MNRLALLMMIVLVGSGLVLVNTSYEARRLFVEIERAKSEELQLQADTKRLEAERRSEGTSLRVERDARQRLQMRMASPETTVYVSEARGAASGSQP